MIPRISISNRATAVAPLALVLLLSSGFETFGQRQNTPPAAAEAPKAKAKAKAKAAAETQKLDINKATAEEMIDALPGVGTVTARKIVEGRPYKSVDDLEKAGVSARTLEAIRPMIMVAPAASKAEPKAKGTVKGINTGPSGKVNLNTASAEELETLPRVGPARAKEIIEGRPYKSVDDLEKIKGLGKAGIEGLRAHVTAAAPDSVPAASTAKPATKPAMSKTAAPSTATSKSATSTAGTAKAKLEPGEVININTASQAELERLFGIGPVKSQAIIDYRAETPFKTIEDIMKVKGIKEGEFAKIKDQIRVK